MDDNQGTEGQGTEGELPTNLAELNDEQLADALASALSEAEGITGTEPEDVARLEALADHADAIEAEQSTRAEAAEARESAAQAARDRLAARGEGGGDEGDEGAEGEGAEGGAEGEGEGAEAAPEAVAASGGTRTGRPPMPRPRRQPEPRREPAAPVMSIVAAAGLKGAEAGASLEGGMSQVAEQFIARAAAFPQGQARQKNVRHQYGVVTLQRNFEQTADGLWYGNADYRDTQSLLAAAADESRLPGGSLIAAAAARRGQGLTAAGWCAPSETLYGLVADETLDGIGDLPTVGIDRGGINFTPGPDFADIYTSAGFSQTEAEAIAGTEKSCVEVDCPDFDEVRLDAVGICVKAGLLTRSAYPELIQRWLEGTVVANQHKVWARLVASMRTALGTALAPTLTGTPITWSTLTALELIGEGQRQAYRLGEGQTLEVIAPRWLRIAIRADLANRFGVGAERITNELIDQHFADRGLRVQWVLGYDELASPLTNVAFKSSTEVMMFPAGTFVKGTADVISLDTVYDTADLQTNTYTAAFAEDGVLLAKMKHGGKRITLPVKVSGQLGAANLDDTWGTAQVPNAGAAAA